uniref:AC transposase n=1 Tax=Cajanus cajan TaxID=3821 RepID=A0A151RVS0_CAJCA|nr:Putative AC transposase [Cajanus cajan]
MFIAMELPFRNIEHEALREFLSIIAPSLTVYSRTTLARHTLKLWDSEKAKLKKFLSRHCHRVCLTTDMWTSRQNLGYMCLTAHFIDNNWKLQKKILNFCQVTSHSGKTMAKTVEHCLSSWGLKTSKGFEELEMQDKKYIEELEKGKGVPTFGDWEFVRGILPFLKLFYDATMRISGSSYVTSNMYMFEAFGIGIKIKQMCASKDVIISMMAENMKKKYDKYWGNPDRLNMLLLIALVLHPRYKLKFMHWLINQSFDGVVASNLKDKVESSIRLLFEEYFSNQLDLINLNAAYIKIHCKSEQHGEASQPRPQRPWQGSSSSSQVAGQEFMAAHFHHIEQQNLANHLALMSLNTSMYHAHQQQFHGGPHFQCPSPETFQQQFYWPRDSPHFEGGEEEQQPAPEEE